MKKENNYYKVNLLNMTNQILASKLLYCGGMYEV